MTWPREYGGGERSNVERLAVTEELLRACAPVAAHWIGDRQVGPAILRHGSLRLRREILPLIVSSEAVFCLGMSEPEAGSDLAAVRTTASPVPGGWVVRGRKTWTSNAHCATHMYLLARTGKSDVKHEGLSEFVVDMSSPGISVSPIKDMTGEHHFNEVYLDGVFVPEHRVLGVVGNGWRQVTGQLALERGGAERVLTTHLAFEQLIAYSRLSPTRSLYGVIGGLAARLTVLRRLCLDVARALDAGQSPIQQAAVLKYLGNAFERDLVEAMRSTPLADGAMRGSVFAESLLVSPGFSLRGGASDVLLSIIARQERQQ